VLSTVRSSEVVSDPTNVLALEAAARANAKERCLISCISTERLTQLIPVDD
jgi:hypothetical protein